MGPLLTRLTSRDSQPPDVTSPKSKAFSVRKTSGIRALPAREICFHSACRVRGGGWLDYRGEGSPRSARVLREMGQRFGQSPCALPSQEQSRAVVVFSNTTSGLCGCRGGGGR